MSNFIWVRNPTIINGLATTYVSKRGSDTIGDGTAQNPFASIAKATSVATSGTNIMLDDGEWNEERTNNNRSFNFWGNAKTELKKYTNIFSIVKNDSYSFIYIYGDNITSTQYIENITFYNCYICNFFSSTLAIKFSYISCIVINSFITRNSFIECKKNIFINCRTNGDIDNTTGYISNNIFIGGTGVNFSNVDCDYNNYTTTEIPKNKGGNLHSINDAITGQTFADYFNYYDANNWLNCDFTAKDGSANIGAGEKGTTIGLNQGYTARADNSANDIFSAANGATVRNCSFSSSLNGYILQQVDRVCAGATSNTITFDADASNQNGYYVGLFVGITEGVGENQIRYITEYNGATKTATVSQAWNTIPDTESEYTISGKIDSAVKDFGKAIKVKRNFTFVDNMTALANGQWAEFLTAATAQNEMQPVSCFKWEYSVDGLTWRSGTELISATDGNNYVDNFTIGDASAQYNEAEAEFAVLRYVRFHIHIGFNIDNLAEA